MSDDSEPPRERPNPKDEDKDGRDDKAGDEDNVFTGEKIDIPKAASNPKDEDKANRDDKDDKAKDEANVFAALDNEIEIARRRAKRDKFARPRVFRNSLSRCISSFLWLAFGTAFVTIFWSLFIFIWHLTIPGAGWLDQEQLDQLRQSLLILYIDTFPPQMPE